MNHLSHFFTLTWLCILLFTACKQQQTPPSTENIPLPEHPRPDFFRADWLNLNGVWEFASDPANVGLAQGWQQGDTPFGQTIVVPFSWAAPASGIEEPDTHIGWYARTLEKPDWNGQVYLVVGASDYETTVWLNGTPIGTHRGGYTPFAFDLTPALKKSDNRLVIRVEDEEKPFRLRGKQNYGDAKGLWQTVYLEHRPATHIGHVHINPMPDEEQAVFQIRFSAPLTAPAQLNIQLNNLEVPGIQAEVPAGQDAISLTLPIRNPIRWTLNNPYLYETTVTLTHAGQQDAVGTYFGMRTIGTTFLPGTDHAYVSLNGEPVYLQLTLDQAYHETGFYTYPSDVFMQEEIMRAKAIGLNGIRVHIKTEIPRKLYWADKLGILVQADIPNFWGDPIPEAKENWEYTAKAQIERDYNHPSIFSWVLFNETWGLATQGEDGKRVYLPETQEWVRQWYHRAKTMDPTRLVEDNSPHLGDHVATDLNTWHSYQPHRRWPAYLNEVVAKTFPGSDWNFIWGNKQGSQPMFNSEIGSVWGYQHGTGDIDLAYEYHFMVNELRRRPKIAGFIFTEFHDVINEWNGYYRFDRSLKNFGLEALFPGMTLRDFHAPVYVITGTSFENSYRAESKAEIPVTISNVSAENHQGLELHHFITGWDETGHYHQLPGGKLQVNSPAFSIQDLPALSMDVPNTNGLYLLCTALLKGPSDTLHRNFVPLRVEGGALPVKTLPITKAPTDTSGASWSVKQKSILNGLKIWGTGTGHFSYTFALPGGIAPDNVETMEFLVEASSRRIQLKDMDEGEAVENMDILNTGKKVMNPGYSPNSYLMSDTTRHPSALQVFVDGQLATTVTLPNDPADHRGLLSWMNQPDTRPARLQEAGSYGYLVKVPFSQQMIEQALAKGQVTIRLEVAMAGKNQGGLAIYGKSFGQYPLDPTLLLTMK
jgi:hypothetical protein